MIITPTQYKGRLKYNPIIVSGTLWDDVVWKMPVCPELINADDGTMFTNGLANEISVATRLAWRGPQFWSENNKEESAIYSEEQVDPALSRIHKYFNIDPDEIILGPELLRDPDFEDETSWTKTGTIADGVATLPSGTYVRDKFSGIDGPGTYTVTLNIISNSGTIDFYGDNGGEAVLFSGTGIQTADFVTIENSQFATIHQPSGDSVIEWASVKKIL